GIARAIALVTAALGAVIGARRTGGALRVRRAVRAVAPAHLRRIALAGRLAAADEAWLEHVGGAGCAGPGARLVHITGAGRRTTDGAGVTRRMLAGIVRSVALVATARVAVVRACRARGLLRVDGTRRARSRAVLRQ